ncbi:type II toxin-antitoxin system PemK/MazF family toxin [Enterovirga aerilata]|uniref:Type II toxin-antitoxin system PemK/MazF family toxin n=1 Tax=Enterovirga aerilata TaxID=2730920 RepID=A0A849IGM6_9HYPH|nr:type II toxin-antitoxin system PemK/MazF family toxin [Enterovirga sp. DB1703]NNM73073.1 type II toxin-antitoxin system PemK/MazF family toxin [Enterovirga sp. DB1703]
MRRGEIWTAAGGKDYAGKQRPVVILQDDRFAATASVTICMFTTNRTEAEFFRVTIDPTPDNGLREVSRAMADKVSTLPRSKIGYRIGRLSDHDMHRLDVALMTFLGLQRRESRQ